MIRVMRRHPHHPPHLPPGLQGDPGSTRFFLSLEDPLFRVFGGDRIKGLMVAFQVEDLPMESSMLSDALDTAQKRVEAYFFDIRK